MSTIFGSRRRLPDRGLSRVQRKLLGDFRQGLIQTGDDYIDGFIADDPRRLYAVYLGELGTGVGPR